MSVFEEPEPASTTPLESEPTLKFYAGLDVRTPGCVILQADDRWKFCAFAPSSLLNGVSSFFRDLPAPSETDLVCGIPLIPLTDVTTEGLAVYIQAIQSISQPEPFQIPHLRIYFGAAAVIEAAAIAKRYDTPIVFRLLVEAVRISKEFEGSSNNKHFVEFAIWAIGGVESQLQAAATATLTTRFTWLSSSLLASIAHHVPQHLIKLQALHLRHHEAPCNFDRTNHRCTCEACCAEQGETNDDAVADLFCAARTTEEIREIDKNDYGLECEDCIEKARESYQRDLEWLRRFTTEYDFDETKPY